MERHLRAWSSISRDSVIHRAEPELCALVRSTHALDFLTLGYFKNHASLKRGSIRHSGAFAKQRCFVKLFLHKRAKFSQLFHGDFARFENDPASLSPRRRVVIWRRDHDVGRRQLVSLPMSKSPCRVRRTFKTARSDSKINMSSPIWE